MSYTPINWQTGDTITAEKMNKMDNGWSVESTQLFSETVTTEDDEGINVATLTYTGLIENDTVTFVFDGTPYECNKAEFGDYGAQWSDELENYDFSTYPFNFMSSAGIPNPEPAMNEIATETAGTHTIAVVDIALQTSENFAEAVNSVVNYSAMPLRCVSGVTPKLMMDEATTNGQMMYFTVKTGDETAYYSITSYDSTRGTIYFTPANSTLNVRIQNNVFVVSSV